MVRASKTWLVRLSSITTTEKSVLFVITWTPHGWSDRSGFGRVIRKNQKKKKKISWIQTGKEEKQKLPVQFKSFPSRVDYEIDERGKWETHSTHSTHSVGSLALLLVWRLQFDSFARLLDCLAAKVASINLFPFLSFFHRLQWQRIRNQRFPSPKKRSSAKPAFSVPVSLRVLSFLFLVPDGRLKKKKKKCP